jgi:hypothetical protein
MPRFDRSGPWGQGPRTGGGFGLCGSGARAGDDAAPESFNVVRSGRINRRAQRQDNRWGGGYMGAGRQGAQGGQRGGQRRGRGGRCWTTGGRFNPNQSD